MDDLHLECRACGRVTVLDTVAQVAILEELKLPAHRKLLECACGHFQFALGGHSRRPEPAEVAK